MGFRLDRTYLLRFEGGLEGAEIRLRATPISTMLLVGGDQTFEEAAKLLCEYVVDWNLEDADGKPIPVTPEAVMSYLEEPVLHKIRVEWYRAAKGVTAPLDPPSTDGAFAGMPMETLESPGN